MSVNPKRPVFSSGRALEPVIAGDGGHRVPTYQDEIILLMRWCPGLSVLCCKFGLALAAAGLCFHCRIELPLNILNRFSVCHMALRSDKIWKTINSANCTTFGAKVATALTLRGK